MFCRCAVDGGGFILQEEDPEKKCKLKILEDLQGSPERSLNPTHKYTSRSTSKMRADRTARDCSKDYRSHSAAYSAPLMNKSEEKWSSFQPICILVSCLLRKIKTGGWFFTGGADHPIAWKAFFFFEKKCANTSKLPASEKQMIQSHYSFVSFSFIEYHRVI